MTFSPFRAREDGDVKQWVVGTHRSRPPEETWEWLQPQLAAYGVTRVADITGLDEVGIPVYQAVRPAGRTLSVSQGKGVNSVLAKISAAMESVETWHAENVTAETDAKTARAWGSLPYNPNELESARGTWWHDEVPVPWIFGEGLVSGRRIPVPLGCIRIDFTFRSEWAPSFFCPNSNGLAGGNSITEATVHALCEVAERDTAAELHRVGRRPQLDPDTVDNVPCQDLLASFADAHIATDVWYSPGRCGIHCFEVIGRSSGVPPNCSGAGCHLDPAVALARAVTEAAQSRLTFIAGSRDDDDRPIPWAPRWGSPTSEPRPSGPLVDWATLVDAATPRMDDDMAALAAAIDLATGCEPIRVILPSPTGVPVVRVVAPGLVMDTTLAGGS